MPIDSRFNSVRHMMQLMRYQNMAHENGTQAKAQNISQAQVEIANIQEYGDGSHNVANVIAAIRGGKGRIQSSEAPIVEDGAILPSDVIPSRQIKDIKPIMNYQVNVVSNASINELRMKQLEEELQQAQTETVEAEQGEPILTGTVEMDTNTIPMEHAVEEYQKQLDVQKELTPIPAPAIPVPEAAPQTQIQTGTVTQSEQASSQSVGNTIDIKA